MKVKELFNVGGPIQSLSGVVELLDYTNCKVTNKTKQEKAVVFKMMRESDGQEGTAYLRVLPQYDSVAQQLVNWAFANNSMIGLNLNDIAYMDTNIQITSIDGKMMFGLKEI